MNVNTSGWRIRLQTGCIWEKQRWTPVAAWCNHASCESCYWLTGTSLRHLTHPNPLRSSPAASQHQSVRPNFRRSHPYLYRDGKAPVLLDLSCPSLLTFHEWPSHTFLENVPSQNKYARALRLWKNVRMCFNEFVSLVAVSWGSLKGKLKGALSPCWLLESWILLHDYEKVKRNLNVTVMGVTPPVVGPQMSQWRDELWMWMSATWLEDHLEKQLICVCCRRGNHWTTEFVV